MNENITSLSNQTELLSLERKKEIAYKLFNYIWKGVHDSKSKREIKDWISSKGIDAVAKMLNISLNDLKIFLKEE